MGALVGTTCYAVAQDATNATYSAMPATSSMSGAYVYEVHYVYNEASATDWQRCVDQRAVSDGALASSSCLDAPSVAFATCDPSDGLSDGIAVGWLIASALVAVAALKFIKRAAS